MIGAREGQISEWENAKRDPSPRYREAYYHAGLLAADEALLPFRAAA